MEIFSKKIAPMLNAIDDSQTILHIADPKGEATKYMYTTNRIPKEPVE